MHSPSHLTEQSSSSVSPASPTDLAQKAASGIAWTALLGLAGRGISLLSQLLLAKLLLPEDFGLFGLAGTVAALFSMLTSFGIDQVFLQRYPRLHFWATQAFLLSLGFSLIAAVTMAAYAPLAGYIYQDGRITSLIWIMAAALPFSALATVPQAQLQSRLSFKFLALYSAVEQLVLQSAIILCAWTGMGSASFVLPLPFVALTRALVFWHKAPLPLRSLSRSKGWSLMAQRGGSAFAVGLLATCIGQSDYATLGLVASAHVVGVYYFAFRLSWQPMALLASSFTGVLRPSLVAMNGDVVRQRNAALKAAEALALLTVPVCFLQAAVADPGLTLLFGSRWSEAIPLIQILNLALPLDAPSWAAGSLLESRGQFGRSLRYQLMSAPFFFIFVGIGAWFGSATGVAIGVAAYYILHPIYLCLIVFLREGETANRVLACFYRPILLGSITIGGACLLGQNFFVFAHPLVQIAFIVLTGGSAYLLGIRLISPELYRDIKRKLMKTAFLTRTGKLI